ncbi:Uncharacterised protein [Bacillus freudenreichii]|nr:Uncharacterised protein [Bacillus freudenreichii]
MLLQIMLINFVKNNSEWGLGSEFNFSSVGITDLLKYRNKITGAEILQLMVLFSNQGHFKDTFSSNKVWFHILYTNKHRLKSFFKKGLSKQGKVLLEKLLSNSEYQKIQWLNTLFILSRSAKLQDYRLICEHIINKILGNKSDNWDKWIDIYSKIRKVAYIVLDSHFSHIPVSISLQNVLFNEELFIDELSKNKSGLMGTFDRINDLLEDTLYLENNALLMGTYRSMDIFAKVNKYIENNQQSDVSISLIKDLISNESESPFNEAFKVTDDNIPWNPDKNLSVTFPIRDREKFPLDVFQNELNAKKKLGRDCYIGFNFSPDFAKYRTVYSLNKKISDVKLLRECLKVICFALDDYINYRAFSYGSVDNGPFEEVVIKKVITYLFRNLLKEDYYCDFNYSKSLPPLIIGNGIKNVLGEVNSYIKEYQVMNPTEKDVIHELNAVKQSLESISYRGLVIVYIGSLRFINSQKKSECELDGLIFTPKNKDVFLRVIEAKNISKKDRCSVAIHQLNRKFVPLLPAFMDGKFENEKIEGYGAQINIQK